MKTLFIATALTALISSGALTSCSANKKMQASKAPVKTEKTDSVEVIRETKSTSVKPKTIEKETVTAVPPGTIEKQFVGDHSKATDVRWTKETEVATGTTGTNTSGKATYKAGYTESDKKNWIIYSEEGTVIEERHEILADQIPQNIYNSIKERYPDFKVVSAYTYKHLKQEGSYAVIIKPTSTIDSTERELIVRENGTFVQ